MSLKKDPKRRVASIAPFGLRMPPGLRDRIAVAAEASGRSMNAEIVGVLEVHYPPEPTIQELLDGLRLINALYEKDHQRSLRSDIRRLLDDLYRKLSEETLIESFDPDA